MAERALEVYQGHDWLTYRWPVAQMFDTLDRIRELCLQASLPPPGSRTQRMEVLPPRFMFEDDRPDVFLGIVDLCDDMSGEIDAVQAELFPHLLKSAAHRWMCFEMRLYLRTMRQATLAEHQSPHSCGPVLDMILTLTAHIRDLLRSIDQ